MENAKVVFVDFDSADVITTSRIRYGFVGQEIYRFSGKDVPAYNINPNAGRGYVPDERIDENDAYVYNFWVDISNSGDSVEINGTEFSTNDWTNVTKWLWFNTVDKSWSLGNRSGQ